MIETNLPVLLLKELILLPFNEIRIEISKEEDKKVLNISEQNHENYILCVNVPDFVEEKPNIRHLPKIAILAKIKSKIELPNGLVRLVLIGIDRVEVLNYVEDNDNNLYSYVVSTKEYDFDEMEATALKRILLKDLNEYIEISPYISNNVLGRINGINNIGRLSDIIAFELPIDYHDKLKYIEMTNPMNRLKLTIEDLHKEIETVKIEDEIETTLKSKIDIEQRNYILREKIRLIKEELEEDNLKENDIKEIKQKLLSLQAPEKIKERIQKEIEKYEMLSDNSPEVGIIRNYIECLMSLPWEISTEDNKDISKIKDVLDNSHYGLNEIKERIIEYIATKDIYDKDQSIICFVGPPGVGKTTMALSFAKAMGISKKRIQFTTDIMPSDLVGFSIYDNETKLFKYQSGALMCNLFLADEINRTSPKTQAALLEVMEEKQITVDGVTRSPGKPFVVIATENPEGSAGTQPLPDSQLDRFMICIHMGYPSVDEEVEILKRRQKGNPIENVRQVCTAEDIIAMQNEINDIYIHDLVFDYIARLAKATREDELLKAGLSPRGTVALAGMSRALAWMDKRNYVIPKDVSNAFEPVALHRITLSTKAKVGNVKKESITKKIVAQVKAPIVRNK